MAWTPTDAMVTRYVNDLGADGRKRLLKQLGAYDQVATMARAAGYADGYPSDTTHKKNPTATTKPAKRK